MDRSSNRAPVVIESLLLALPMLGMAGAWFFFARGLFGEFGRQEFQSFTPLALAVCLTLLGTVAGVLAIIVIRKYENEGCSPSRILRGISALIGTFHVWCGALAIWFALSVPLAWIDGLTEGSWLGVGGMLVTGIPSFILGFGIFLQDRRAVVTGIVFNYSCAALFGYLFTVWGFQIGNTPGLAGLACFVVATVLLFTRKHLGRQASDPPPSQDNVVAVPPAEIPDDAFDDFSSQDR